MYLNVCKMLSEYLLCISDLNEEVLSVIMHSLQSLELLRDCADCTLHTVLFVVPD